MSKHNRSFDLPHSGVIRGHLLRNFVVMLVVMAAVTVQLEGLAAASGDPTAPTLTSVAYSNDGATLFFAAPSELIGTTITSYDYQLSRDGGATVYYSENTGTWPNSYGNTGATSSPYTDPNASSFCPVGTSCSWRIRAEFDNGDTLSPWSDWVAMTPFGGAPSLTVSTTATTGPPCISLLRPCPPA